MDLKKTPLNLNDSPLNLADAPFKWYVPKNTENGSSDAWANDPCSILYDEETKLYYSWMLFRNGKDFPSGWIEMISSDMNEWTQTEIRVKEGREFFQVTYPPAAMGGSVWIDRKGKFFDKGDVVFLISMQKCRLMDNEGTVNRQEENKYTEDSGLAYFVSHGLGKPIHKAGVLTYEGKNPTSTDWRDPAMYETEDGLYFAISAHDRIEFWKINSFELDDITKVDQLYVRSVGVEVPNVIRFGENTWYISCAVQDRPEGGDYQSAYWYLCKLIEGKFKVYAQGQHEYGTEGYAHRVVNPWQTKIAPFGILRAMPANWNYNTDIWDWKGGCYGSEQLTIKDNKAFLAPYDWVGNYSNNGTAVYKIKARKMLQGYNLRFNKGDFTFYLQGNKVIWNNNVDTGLVKWNSIGGPAKESDDITIIWNKCTLTFYNITEGWNAHFMLPQGTTHTLNENPMGLIYY